MARKSTIEVVAGDVGSLGCILAVVLSWHANHSILWAMAHFLCSWFYVVYFAIEKAS